MVLGLLQGVGSGVADSCWYYGDVVAADGVPFAAIDTVVSAVVAASCLLVLLLL